jgi:UDP-glucose 4-epimerase
MAILVTGGAGYIGSVTVEGLKAENECVIVLDDLENPSRHPSACDQSAFSSGKNSGQPS